MPARMRLANLREPMSHDSSAPRRSQRGPLGIRAREPRLPGGSRLANLAKNNDVSVDLGPTAVVVTSTRRILLLLVVVIIIVIVISVGFRRRVLLRLFWLRLFGAR